MPGVCFCACASDYKFLPTFDASLLNGHACGPVAYFWFWDIALHYGHVLQIAKDFMEVSTQITSLYTETWNRSLKAKTTSDFLQNYPDGELSLKGRGCKLCSG